MLFLQLLKPPNPQSKCFYSACRSLLIYFALWLFLPYLDKYYGPGGSLVGVGSGEGNGVTVGVGVNVGGITIVGAAGITGFGVFVALGVFVFLGLFAAAAVITIYCTLCVVFGICPGGAV